MLINANELITGTFFFANAGRMLAYVPQLKAAWICNNGAKAISRSTWGYFAFAHLSGVLYGQFVAHDSYMALIFSGNFLVCCLLLGIITWKSVAYDRLHRQGAIPAGAHLSGNVVMFEPAQGMHGVGQLQSPMAHGTMTAIGGSRYDGRLNNLTGSRSAG